MGDIIREIMFLKIEVIYLEIRTKKEIYGEGICIDLKS